MQLHALVGDEVALDVLSKPVAFSAPPVGLSLPLLLVHAYQVVDQSKYLAFLLLLQQPLVLASPYP